MEYPIRYWVNVWLLSSPSTNMCTIRLFFIYMDKFCGDAHLWYYVSNIIKCRKPIHWVTSSLNSFLFEILTKRNGILLYLLQVIINLRLMNDIVSFDKVNATFHFFPSDGACHKHRKKAISTLEKNPGVDWSLRSYFTGLKVFSLMACFFSWIRTINPFLWWLLVYGFIFWCRVFFHFFSRKEVS